MSEINGLTQAEEEMLTLTMEECAELIQRCSKVLSFGIGHLPTPDHLSTREGLEEESADVSCCLMILEKNGLIRSLMIRGHMASKFARIRDPSQRRFHYITPDMVP